MKNGFSLIELMITVAILAIVASVAAPNFITTIKNNRLTSQANGFIGAFNYARSEAVKRGQNNVTICASTDGSSCTGNNDWELGYAIFLDTDNDGALDTGEDVLRVGDPLTGGNTLRAAGFTDNATISVTRQGMIATVGTFQICDDRGASEARAIVLNISGQSRMATDDNTPADDIVNGHDGSNITCP